MNATVLKKLSLKAASNFDKTEAEASSRWIKISGKIPAGVSKLEVVSPTMNWKTTNYISYLGYIFPQAYIVFDLYILKSLHLVPLSPGVPVGSVPTCPKKCFSPNSFQTHVFFVFLRGVSFLELFSFGASFICKGGPFSKK